MVDINSYRTPYFLIGDIPVIFSQTMNPELQPSLGGIVSIALPISPNAILITSNLQVAEKIEEANENIVNAINQTIYDQSERLIFGRQTTDFAGMLEWLDNTGRLNALGSKRKGTPRPSFEYLKPGFDQMLNDAKNYSQNVTP